MNEPSNIGSVLAQLEAGATEKQKKRIIAQGVADDYVIGAPKNVVNKLAKSLGTQHQLALALWDSGFHEARLLAVLIADADKMTQVQHKRWISGLWSWSLCDQYARYLLPYTKTPGKLINHCAHQQQLYSKRLAFAGMACCVIHGRVTDDEIEHYLKLINKAAKDDRHYVRKAVVWALVEIGKRSTAWHEEAIIQASELLEGDKAQQWVGRNALKELQNLMQVPERKRLLNARSKTAQNRRET